MKDLYRDLLFAFLALSLHKKPKSDEAPKPESTEAATLSSDEAVMKQR